MVREAYTGKRFHKYRITGREIVGLSVNTGRRASDIVEAPSYGSARDIGRIKKHWADVRVEPIVEEKDER